MKPWVTHLSLGLLFCFLAIGIRLDVLPQAAAFGTPTGLAAFGLLALVRARTAALKLWVWADYVGAGLAAAWLVALQRWPELADLSPYPPETIAAYVLTTLGLQTQTPASSAADAITVPIEVWAPKVDVVRAPKRPGPVNLDESSPTLTTGEPPKDVA